jgi:hypothetical protein
MELSTELIQMKNPGHTQKNEHNRNQFFFHTSRIAFDIAIVRLFAFALRRMQDLATHPRPIPIFYCCSMPYTDPFRLFAYQCPREGANC